VAQHIDLMAFFYSTDSTLIKLHQEKRKDCLFTLDSKKLVSGSAAGHPAALEAEGAAPVCSAGVAVVQPWLESRVVSVRIAPVVSVVTMARVAVSVLVSMFIVVGVLLLFEALLDPDGLLRSADADWSDSDSLLSRLLAVISPVVLPLRWSIRLLASLK
jgi:hypothetical protein